ncbi:hypothetical protein N7494_004925 [Penicillium frequentans]|uniref:Zn(2)-C6 fungal-type domain-containing protein n=1 Tax=Penicillium frequentans TaxID=3151616 RepID=A0AAD6D1K2_9EURO|nr:hypothetical protein N7494_004925 [Penicillium glabrum]
MSLSKQVKSGVGQLPKSVKVRSTCNACQQAKIRCSHEKPSCRRCQRHKIECIYSVSRRLGRPAKKKDCRIEVKEQGGNLSPETLEDLECERAARRTSRKKGNRSGSGTAIRPRGARAQSILEEQLSTPTLPDNVDESGMSVHLHEMNAPICHPAFGMDFTSENWAQQLMSTCLNEPSPEQTYAEIELEDTFNTPSGHTRPSAQVPIYPSGDPYFPSLPLGPDSDLETFQTPKKMAFLNAKDQDTAPWSYSTSILDMQPIQDAWMLERPHQPMPVLIDPSNSSYCPLQSPDTSPDSGIYSPGKPGPLSPPPNFSCTCYKRAMSELIRSGLCAEPDGFVSIDSILACQNELLLQTEAILRCNVCSQSEGQGNMLMVVIVTIDSLLSTLDTTTTLAEEMDEEGVPSHSQLSASGKLRDLVSGDGFKSHFDACPLLVGGYRVPLEEKSCFILQVLQGRLSMLLLAIRRIRACMQQHLAAVFSRGRMLMIMETDRRLQVILMKIRMAVV